MINWDCKVILDFETKKLKNKWYSKGQFILFFNLKKSIKHHHCKVKIKEIVINLVHTPNQIKTNNPKYKIRKKIADILGLKIVERNMGNNNPYIINKQYFKVIEEIFNSKKQTLGNYFSLLQGRNATNYKDISKKECNYKIIEIIENKKTIKIDHLHPKFKEKLNYLIGEQNV